MISFRSDRCSRSTLDVSLAKAAGIAGLVVISVAGLALWMGFEFGGRYAERAAADTATADVQAILAAERRLIADAKAEQRAHLDALAFKIAALQSHLIRLDALGERLVEVGKLDRDEFDFASQPPRGGIDDALPGEHSGTALQADLRRLERLLDDREKKLQAMEHVLVNRGLMAEVTPSGRPVVKGWMSSGFGRRIDPFKGTKSFHRGVDFAGKPGSEVVAVASGVVTRSKHTSGYGNFIKIRHADGYSTLYAHNQENLVRKGEVVSKGQTIGLLGSTGRSSGPHVHFEVHKDGKIVDPLRYVRTR